MTARAENWQGMNWIRQEKRLAIYMRDGCACVWCGATAESGAQLTLDHLVVAKKNGNNDATNLVTACFRCNSSRGARSMYKFAEVMAAYLNHGIKPLAILANIGRLRKRVLDVPAAKALIARRGSLFNVIQKGSK